MLFEDPSSSFLARIFCIFILLAIFLSMITIVLASLDEDEGQD